MMRALLLGVVLSLVLGCAMDRSLGAADESPQDPPLPRTESVLPLEKGNRWVYSDTHYDSTGKRMLSREELNLEISGVCGLTRDGRLVELEAWGFLDTFPQYVHRHEWEETKTGYLVAYRDIGVSVRGVYIFGEYNGAFDTLYASPLLWLAFPADSGTTWDLSLPGATDTVPTRMEVLSTSARFYFPDTTLPDLSAARFYGCYLYKQSSGSRVSYYYYHEAVGAVGYLRYVDDVLRRTYILKAFSRARY